MIGKIEILLHIMDKIVYDENNEPRISTSKFPVLTGKLKIYNTTQTIKDLQIPIKVDGKISKLNCSFYVRTNHKMNEKITENENNFVTSSPPTTTTAATIIPILTQEINKEDVQEVQESSQMNMNMNIVPTEIDFEDAIPLEIDKTKLVKKEFVDSFIKQEISFSASNSPKTPAQDEFETFVIKTEDVKVKREDVILVEDSDEDTSITDSAEEGPIPMPKKFKILLVDVLRDGRLDSAELLQNYGAEMPEFRNDKGNQPIKAENINEVFPEFDINHIDLTK